jgi:hypothetical protein
MTLRMRADFQHLLQAPGHSLSQASSPSLSQALCKFVCKAVFSIVVGDIHIRYDGQVS